MTSKVVLRVKNIEMFRDLFKPLIVKRQISHFVVANSNATNSHFLWNRRSFLQKYEKQVPYAPRFAPQLCQFGTSGIEDKKPENNKLTLFQRFKLMYKEYWYVLLPVHVATSACWLGGFYYMAVSGMDISALLEVAGAPESWVTTMRESKAGGIVTAYTMYKIVTPARYTVTLGTTTVSINYLKKWGMIKPMPSREKLKVMYEDRKTALKSKMTATSDEIIDEFAKTRKEITDHVKEAKTGLTQSVNETREGFKEGVREAADEWRHVGKLIKRNVKEIIKPEKREGSK